MGDFFKGMGVLVTGFIVVVVAVAAIMTVQYFSAETRGKVGMEEHVASGAFQEYSYDHFFDTCAAIQGYEQSIIAQQGALKSATDEDRGRINSILFSIQAERGRSIAQYNADASKIRTVARFKADGLPNYINPQSENTQCAN